MAQRSDVFKCDKCGLIVEAVHSAAGSPSCCGEPMKLRVANTEDAVQEKHVPVVSAVDEGTRVDVGSVMHPATAEHFIEWIEVIRDGRVIRQYLSPDEAPSAVFCGCVQDGSARAYCNLHGLWKAG